MGDHIHAYRSAHCVKQVDHCLELLLDGVKLWACLSQFLTIEFRVDLPTAYSVQAADHTRFPDGEEMDRVLHFGDREGVLDNVPKATNRADVDAYHVAQSKRLALRLMPVTHEGLPVL